MTAPANRRRSAGRNTFQGSRAVQRGGRDAMTIDAKQLILIFTSIIYEALPFIVLGVIIAGFLEEFVPQQIVANIFRSRFLTSNAARLGAIGVGGLLGLLFPMCECGIIPIMRRLLRKGVPLSVCICYMLAGPIINAVVMLSTYVAFDFPQKDALIFGGPLGVMGLRVGLGFVVAVVASVVVEWQYRKHGNKLFTPALAMRDAPEGDETPAAVANPRRLTQRLGGVAETARHDFVDIMAFLVLGATLAALGRIFLAQSNFERTIQQGPLVAIVLMMGLAIVFCLCSEADAFIAANFSPYFPPAAKIAFLVLGPMLDFKLYLMYVQVFRHRLIWTIIISVVVQVLVYTLALHYLWPDHGFSPEFLTRLSR
jgi:uncharacterized protein